MSRRVLLLLIAGAVAWLLPWTGYLLTSLPDQHDTAQWRLAWVGFDVALLICFAAAAWLGWRHRRAAVPVLIATAAMMCCDAWFDVVLDWGGPGQGISLLMAGAQIPVAALLAMRARTLLAGDSRPRQVTVQDIEVSTDTGHQRLLSRLKNDEATVDELAAATGGRHKDVATALRELARLGYVRSGKNGRWRTTPIDLRKPDVVHMSVADRARIQAWYDAKLENELSLFRRAFHHPERFGPWSQASRSTVVLTEDEIVGFADEYMDLLNRYAALHEHHAARGNSSRTRPILVRLYAFPQDLAQDTRIGA